MRRKIKLLLVLILISSSMRIDAQVKALWETDDNFKAPESVVYDQKRGVLYVSNYTKRIRDGASYGDCCVSKVDINGKIIKFDWIPNLTSPTGLYIFNDMLYIVERFGVVEYDLSHDKVNNSYLIKQASFLNDITVENDSNIYVTDSGSKTIYRIKNGKVTKWMDSIDISYPNGIQYDEGKLIVGVNGDNYLKSIDIITKEIHNIAFLGEGLIDGIKKSDGGYLVSLYFGSLLLVKHNGEVTQLLDTKEKNIPCADFEYIKNQKMVIVPTLWNNKLYGYKYEPK